MTVASSSSNSYTADGTIIPQLTPPSTQSLGGSLPPLVPPKQIMPESNLIGSNQSNARPSSKDPIPMSSTAYHAYFATSNDDDDDDEDYDSDDESPSQSTQQDTETSKNDVEDKTKASDIEDVDKYFQVPHLSTKDKNEIDDDLKSIPTESPADNRIASKADESGAIAKCENKSLPHSKLTATDQTTAPHAEVDEPNYYMRVARVLLGILILLVFGYIVYWVLLNVFGIDLWTVLCEKLWGKSNVYTTTDHSVIPVTQETAHVSVEGQQQKQALTDKTAVTLLDMMTAIRKHNM